MNVRPIQGQGNNLNETLSRRNLLKLIAQGSIAATGITILENCKGSTTPEPPPPPPPPAHDVSVTVKFYNHTQGPLGEKQYNGKSNGGLGINIYDLGFSGVYPTRIAVRKSGDIETMGSLLAFSKTSSISVPYPQNNETWEAYLMNFRENTYELNDADEQFGCKLSGPRNITWSREDSVLTGPDEPIIEAVRQINEALSFPWKKYGSLTQSNNGSVKIGYADLANYYDPYIGSIRDQRIAIDPNRLPTYESRLETFIIATFGYLTITGLRVAIEQYTNHSTGNLTPLGKDLLAYFYVKDAQY